MMNRLVHIVAFGLVFCALVFAVGSVRGESVISFDVTLPGRTSLGVYDAASGRLLRTLLRGERLQPGRHEVAWDGLDDFGKPVPPGDYQWRLLTAPGLVAKYVTTVGINPPGGEHPVPNQSWVGDHFGPGTVAVDSTGVYVGSTMTEGMLSLLKADADMTKVLWRRPQFYDGGQLRRVAAGGGFAYMLDPFGKLRRLSAADGKVQAEWQIAWDGVHPIDIAARGSNLIAVYADKNVVAWLSPTTGQPTTDVSLPGVTSVTALGDAEQGEALAAAASELFRVVPNQPPQKLAALPGKINAIDYDAARQELWALLDECKVVRLNASWQVEQTYGGQPRQQGPFNPAQFAGGSDIAADLQGGFYLTEPAQGARRLVHVDRDGNVLGQWFGGMSFYVSATFDPGDPGILYGISQEGTVNVYRMDYQRGTWKLEASYNTGLLGDGLFPGAAAFKAVRRNGQTYLYHRVIPAVLRLDAATRSAVPVAIAGRVLNNGRSFFQFAGTGREGYPKPWVAAAEHHGFKELAQAPPLYSWADSNGNGQFESEEFRFYPTAKRGISFHNLGDFAPNGDYLAAADVNEPQAMLRLPMVGWEGPNQAAPRWDWSQLQLVGDVTANPMDFGAPRGVSVTDDGSAFVAYQAGLQIREHGQYEGGRWPEQAVRGSRLLGFDPQCKPLFVAGRQSKNPAEANTGMFYYPVQTMPAPNRGVVVNDQTVQPGQVWTHDGLYVGGLFDGRADDGLDEGFYQVHGDDNQGGAMATAQNGKTYWLMPYIGHNRLYEISGWQDWQRQTGQVTRPTEVATASGKGTGLSAKYYAGDQLLHSAVEEPVYYEQFGPERHEGKVAAPFRVVWTGSIEAPMTDEFSITTLIGENEKIAIEIDGKLVHAAGTSNDVTLNIKMRAGQRYPIRIGYSNNDGRAELKLLWSSRVLDPMRVPQTALFPE